MRLVSLRYTSSHAARQRPDIRSRRSRQFCCERCARLEAKVPLNRVQATVGQDISQGSPRFTWPLTIRFQYYLHDLTRDLPGTPVNPLQSSARYRLQASYEELTKGMLVLTPRTPYYRSMPASQRRFLTTA